MNVVVILIIVIATCHAASINLEKRGDETELSLERGNPARRQNGFNLGLNTQSGQPQFSAGFEKQFNGGNTNVGANVNVGLDGKPGFSLSGSHNIDKYTKLDGGLNGGPQGTGGHIGITHDNQKGTSWFGRVGVGPGGPSVGAGLQIKFKKRNILVVA